MVFLIFLYLMIFISLSFRFAYLDATQENILIKHLIKIFLIYLHVILFIF